MSLYGNKQKTVMSNKTNTPQIRFPEFSGEWEKKRLGDIAIFLKGKGIPKADISENGKTECIRYGELYTHYSEVIDEVISKTDVSIDNLVFSKANDVIVPASGETQIDIATASCVLRAGVALGGDLNIIRSEINGIYLSYYLNNAKKKSIARLSQGISVVHLYPSQLKTLSLNLPSLPEQEKIASFLTAVDERIELLQKKKEKLEEYKKGVMQKLFSQEIRFKDENGNDYPEWEVGKINTIFELQDGYPFSSKDFTSDTKDFKQIIRITDINNKNKNSDKMYLIPERESDLDLESSQVNKGDLLLSLTGAAGFNFFIWNGDKSYINQRTVKLSPKSEENSKLVYLMEELIHSELNRKYGTGQNNNLSKKDLNNITFKYPNSIEQDKIASFLTSLDDKIDIISKEIEQSNYYKKGLLQKMFV